MEPSNLTAARARAIAAAAIAGGALVVWVVLSSDHQDAKAVWAIFGPAVGWSFVGTGLYAWRRRPESRTGLLMVLLGFAWFLSILVASDVPAIYTFALLTGGLWGGVFLHLGMSFPTGRLAPGIDRALVIAGYVIFPLASAPALPFAGPQDLGCSSCPPNLLLIERDADLAAAGLVFGALAYAGLFVLVLVRSVRRWRATPPLERLQLTPVYVCALLTFLLVATAKAGAGDAAWWAAFVSSALLPFAFLGGLLRSHVSQLDAELRERLEELRASRARLVEAGDAERRRLERDLHDGAQARLVALALLLRTARAQAGGPLVELLDRAQEELQAGLSELRELARGIHPALLTERGLEPALQALVARVPVPVTLEADAVGRLPDPADAVARLPEPADADEGPPDPADAVRRLPEPIESAAYFVVSEALANVSKYARATHATVTVRRIGGRVAVEVADDGVGGADAAQGSGLRGLADRVAALDGTLALDSPPGRGTRLRVEIPVR